MWAGPVGGAASRYILRHLWTLDACALFVGKNRHVAVAQLIAPFFSSSDSKWRRRNVLWKRIE